MTRREGGVRERLVERWGDGRRENDRPEEREAAGPGD